MLVLSAGSNLVLAQAKSANKDIADCVPVASWVVPTGRKISGNEVIARAVKQQVVLLGEMHDNLGRVSV